ncbi:MAG: hypothetical protein ABIP79_06400 [Chitinophagaceae bacterium]
MRKPVKPLVLLTIFSFFFLNSSAQLKLPLANGIAADVKKVIEDYPNRFINLMGEVINQHPQSTEYNCNFKVNGAEEAFVTRYSAKKEVCSWEALMLTTENFDKAKQKFKLLYNQLQNMAVKFDGVTYKLKGEYDTPDEAKKFASVLFSFEPANAVAAKLKIEVSIQFIEPMEWKVKLMVYDRDREDDERGQIKE